MRVLHFSDVHVQVDYAARPWLGLGWRRLAAQLELRLGGRAARYVRAEETIARIVAEAERHRVDHVVLSGDLTALALDEEFAGARRALGALADDPTRLTVIPGNHDVYTPTARWVRRFERHFGNLLRSDLPGTAVEGPWPLVRLVGEGLAIVAVSSARVPPVPGLAAGWVGGAQLGALERILAHERLAGRAVYVVVHHAPVLRDGRADRPTHGLIDASSLLDVCRKGGAAAILCGHVHRRYRHDVPGGPAVINAGSSTWLGREGYFLLTAQDGRLLRSEALALDDATAASQRVAAG